MISVFFHIYPINGYGLIYDELRQLLFKNIKDFNFHPYKENNEFDTLEELSKFCKENESAKVLYIHTKGVTTPNNPCISDWRKYMSYFLIEKYDDCLNALKTVDACGVDWQEHPEPHFSGNFWWANASYINKLPSIETISNPANRPTLTLRHQAEFWIGMNDPKIVSLHQSGIPVMERHLHRYERGEYETI